MENVNTASDVCHMTEDSQEHTASSKREEFTLNMEAVWSQWPRGLRHGSAAARLLGLRLRMPPGHGCLSLDTVVCFQVEVSTTGWSLVQSSRTECGVFERDREAPIMRRSWPIRVCRAVRELEALYIYQTARRHISEDCNFYQTLFAQNARIMGTFCLSVFYYIK
jgi:hypothetical protein